MEYTHYICTHCKKSFEDKPLIKYGLDKGKSFFYCLCPDCQSIITEEEADRLYLPKEDMPSVNSTLGILGE